MISIVVPVYNIETYLPRCLDSILSQTYKDLEILIIDDGSTDRSGQICNNYGVKDSRVRVYHTHNHGLSAARNLGLSHVKGEYIAFVDGDDWLEPDMYEALLRRVKETGADIVECGVFSEYRNRTIVHEKQKLLLSGQEAVWALLRGEFSEAVWNKLWKRQCFEEIHFPNGRIYEDIATTYQVFRASDHVGTICEAKYHYLQRKGSLSKERNMRNLIDYWRVNKERFYELQDQADRDSLRRLLFYCARASSRTWSFYYDCPHINYISDREIIHEMNEFIREHIPLFGYSNWDLKTRFAVFFPHFESDLAIRTSWILNRLCRAAQMRSLFD